MKYAILLIILFPIKAFSQIYDKQIFENDTFYYFNNFNVEDTNLQIPENLPNGKWIIFYENKKVKKYEFTIENGAINGYFRYFLENGVINASGKYENDNVWTFREKLSDNRFKIGTWFYNNQFGNTLESHKIPYNDNDSIFIDDILNKNGKVWFKRIWHKRNGLIQEVHYSESGEIRKDYNLINDTALIIKVWNKKNELQSITWDYPGYRKVFNYKEEINPDRFKRDLFPENTELYYIYNNRQKLSLLEYPNTEGVLIQIKEFYCNGILKKETNFCNECNYNKIVLGWDAIGKLKTIEYYKDNKLNDCIYLTN